jgi:hypothetical protein
VIASRGGRQRSTQLQRLLDRPGQAGLACGGVGMDAIAVEAVDRAAAAEDGAGLEARDALLLQHLTDPAVAGLELGAAVHSSHRAE